MIHLLSVRHWLEVVCDLWIVTDIMIVIKADIGEATEIKA